MVHIIHNVSAPCPATSVLVSCFDYRRLKLMGAQKSHYPTDICHRVRRHMLRDSREGPSHGVQHSGTIRPLRGFGQTLPPGFEELSRSICECHEGHVNPFMRARNHGATHLFEPQTTELSVPSGPPNPIVDSSLVLMVRSNSKASL